eukprot:CAMPEP_0117028754 /NCGR_PEP_ID=MMETSP0472-20121206/20882_1 /TAXON_ID=693140 ORGANISM="Tiarina fusus, Strain LIS" /NCGR_SAMPLE_ID=MMETSP0472 /ASSEMBLY_ACC=CAM_ASM_000603 /LENGTH=213 /DNA_ID=CAMNT_0004736335 /DNA_START=243 /DNA_END=884 /DNA_ORIENTATION=-
MKVESFTEKPVGEIANLSNKDPFVSVKGTDSALCILDLFASGVHRAAVNNDNGELVNVVSQFDFIRFVAKHLDLLPELSKQSIKDAGLGQSWVLHVRKTERAISCFAKMVENGMNATGIVDLEGKLYGQLSSTSLRGLTAETFKSLRLPVEEFLNIQNEPLRKSAVCVSEQSFEDVVNRLIAESTHRLWIENAAGFPAGVISLTDICLALKNK